MIQSLDQLEQGCERSLGTETAVQMQNCKKKM